ncbi:MAG TPA: hypothetical protein VGW12_07870 [Pyrinomonadaceae bacterium]|nr:hypothetical protein [Pyrinomonadaceae bacterium]
MSPSLPLDTMPPLFKSLTALRSAHTNLLKEYQKYDDDEDENKLPDSFVKEVELFLQRASSSGALLDIDEDRADAQALLNYWTTVLYNAGQTPRPTVLANFEEEVASRQVGERCPYRGLQAFHLEDRPYFYGRRQLAREMTNWLQRENFLAVVGLSGSGKSSIVRAGLIPALQEGALSDSESWTYYDTIVPGPEPLRSLAEIIRPEGAAPEQWYQQHAPQLLRDDGHLLRLVSGEGTTAVVVVDQFEELFTLSQDEAERRAFVANLIRLTKAPDRRHIVIITMRSEFDTYVARLPELQELFERAQIRVSPLSPSDLRKAIEKPAERSGLNFEAGLVEELVHQVLGEPAGLPLLQFTLYKLWEKRQGKDITWAIYRELGGSPREVLARVADATYESFNIIEDRNISRRIMLRLVRPGAGLDVTSNRVRRESLYPVAARDNVNRVLDIWAAAGLLRVTPAAKREDDQIEVMHEALIRNWPKLVAWVEEERVHLRQRLQLTSAAQQWAEHRRDPGGLLGGTLLAEALTYDDLNVLEREFVTASQEAAEEVEREKQRHQQRINALRRLQLIIGSIFVVIAIGLLTLALWQTKKAYAASEEAKREKGNALTAKGLADEAKTAAEIATGKINKTRDDAAAEVKRINDEADKKLDQLKKQTKDELAKLEGYKAKAAEAQKVIGKYEAMARRIKTETDAQLAAAERLEEELRSKAEGYLAVARETRKAADEATDAVQTLQGSSKIQIKSADDLGLRRRNRPIRPGVSISSSSTTAGSLCCVVRDSAGQKYLLSMGYTIKGKVGESVFQPSLIDGEGGTDGERVAVVSSLTNNTSAAIARLLPGVEADNNIPGIGKVTEVGPPAKPGDVVTLVGRTSGVVRGRVIATDETIAISSAERLEGVIVTDRISSGGDGGAPVLDQNGRLIGILWGGGGEKSIVIPIDRILQGLNVELLR